MLTLVITLIDIPILQMKRAQQGELTELHSQNGGSWDLCHVCQIPLTKLLIAVLSSLKVPSDHRPQGLAVALLGGMLDARLGGLTNGAPGLLIPFALSQVLGVRTQTGFS